MPEPPVPPLITGPVADVAAATAAAVRAAAAWRLPAPELLRVGMNGVFTCGEDTVLRVARPGGSPEAALAVADTLSGEGVRVPRPMRHEAFDASGGLWVTAWERIHPVAGAIDWQRVGAMIAATQATPVRAFGVRLPWCGDFPWWQFDRFAAEIEALDPPARTGLRRALDRHAGWGEAARKRSLVVCHGDVHPGNVLVTSSGPVLIDWDLLCIGPPAWDHAALMTWTERWGAEPGIYDAFAAGFGQSLRGDPVAESLAELRLVAATLMRVRAAASDPGAAAEVEARLRYWRGDPEAPMWQAQ